MQIFRVLVALGLILAGTGTAMAAPYQSTGNEPLRQSVGYYTPYGEYIRTYVCWRQFIGYDGYGYAHYRRVCGFR
jgi:uncharacterized SAM-binding protein YcdF (DUF218 family)